MSLICERHLETSYFRGSLFRCLPGAPTDHTNPARGLTFREIDTIKDIELSEIYVRLQYKRDGLGALMMAMEGDIWVRSGEYS